MPAKKGKETKEEEQKKCFVIMPFTVKDVDVGRYPDTNHWQEVYEGLIKPAVKNAGLLCERDDEDTSSRSIVENILSKIEDADLILCDQSSHNPNVFLELGWALRADRPFILIRDDKTKFTFDLNQQYSYKYNHQLQPIGLRECISSLTTIIVNTLSDHERRYSYVKRLSINKASIDAIEKSDLDKELLRDVKHRLENLEMKDRQPSFLTSMDYTNYDLFPGIQSNPCFIESNISHPHEEIKLNIGNDHPLARIIHKI